MSKANTAKKATKTATLALTVVNGNQPREKKVTVIDKAPNMKTNEDTKAERKVALAEAQAAIAAANTSIGTGFWDLGAAAKTIRDRLLFKEAGLTSFNEYISKVLHLSAPHVYNAIQVSEGMPREQAGRVGVACSVAIVKAPEQVKAEVTKLAELGVAPSKVREHARSAQKAARAAAGLKPRGRKAKDLASTEPVEQHDEKVNRDAKGVPETLTGECQVTKEPGLMLICFSALGRKFVVRVRGDEAVFEAGK